MRYRISVLVAITAVLLLPAAHTRAQQTPTITITSPQNGATVSVPVTVSVAIANATVKPASAGDPEAYHYHLFVDVDPATVVQPGQPIPTGEGNIIHTADPTVTLSDLGPGPHTITAVLTRTNHVPLTPNVEAQVHFTVAAGTAAGGAVSAPRTGTGIPDGSSLPAWMPLIALALLGAGSWLIRRRAARAGNV